jgi:hypothetical protein
MTKKNIQSSNSNLYPKINDGILRCEIVMLPYTNKANKINDSIKDYYLRCSVEDYFIKFCECKISKEQILANYKTDKITNPIAVKANIVFGEWDNCDSTVITQSRVGNYVQILEIIKE